MIEELKHIWNVCFDDGEAYSNLYFSHGYSPGNTLVHTVDGRAVAMLSLLPATLVTPHGERKARYVYAVATLPAFRGRGFSSLLAAQADARMRAEDCALAIVVPASEALVHFYRKQGFVPAFFRRTASFATSVKVQADPLEGRSVDHTENEIQKISALRERFFSATGCFVRWDAGILSYILRECRIGGGGAFFFSDRRDEGYTIVERENETLFVREIAVAQHLAPRVLAFLRHHYADCKTIIFHLPIRSPLWNDHRVVQPAAMCKWLTRPCALAEGYFGLLDSN
jgi:predicted acetyltransferase